MVLIKPDTPYYKIQELKSANVFGLGLDINYYSVEETVTCSKKFVEGERYWPEHIINLLPDTPKKPLSIYFRKDHEEYVKSLDVTYYDIGTIPWDTKMCGNWNELGEMLKFHPKQIIFHVNMITSNSTIPEFVSMMETIIKLSTNKKIFLAIAIDHNTPLSIVKEFQKCNINGLVPSTSSFGFNETHKGVEALFNEIPYWPKHILEQLPGAKKTVTKNKIVLTERQAQIANLISERGLSNKKIAQALNITESTVKIHVSAILKSYGVRTRTQLAVMANK